MISNTQKEQLMRILDMDCLTFPMLLLLFLWMWCFIYDQLSLCQIGFSSLHTSVLIGLSAIRPSPHFFIRESWDSLRQSLGHHSEVLRKVYGTLDIHDSKLSMSERLRLMGSYELEERLSYAFFLGVACLSYVANSAMVLESLVWFDAIDAMVDTQSNPFQLDGEEIPSLGRFLEKHHESSPWLGSLYEWYSGRVLETKESLVDGSVREEVIRKMEEGLFPFFGGGSKSEESNTEESQAKPLFFTEEESVAEAKPKLSEDGQWLVNVPSRSQPIEHVPREVDIELEQAVNKINEYHKKEVESAVNSRFVEQDRSDLLLNQKLQKQSDQLKKMKGTLTKLETVLNDMRRKEGKSYTDQALVDARMKQLSSSSTMTKGLKQVLRTETRKLASNNTSLIYFPYWCFTDTVGVRLVEFGISKYSPITPLVFNKLKKLCLDYNQSVTMKTYQYLLISQHSLTSERLLGAFPPCGEYTAFDMYHMEVPSCELYIYLWKSRGTMVHYIPASCFEDVLVFGVSLSSLSRLSRDIDIPFRRRIIEYKKNAEVATQGRVKKLGLTEPLAAKSAEKIHRDLRASIRRSKDSTNHSAILSNYTQKAIDLSKEHGISRSKLGIAPNQLFKTASQISGFKGSTARFYSTSASEGKSFPPYQRKHASREFLLQIWHSNLPFTELCTAFKKAEPDLKYLACSYHNHKACKPRECPIYMRIHLKFRNAKRISSTEWSTILKTSYSSFYMIPDGVRKARYTPIRVAHLMKSGRYFSKEFH